MSLKHSRNLVQDKFYHVDLAQSLLERAAAMGDDLNNLVHKALIWGDFCIPRIDEIFHHDCDDGVQLNVDIIGARQRRQHRLKESGCASI